jgi:Protein of unknown function (DUF1549)/Protein of unknown function (DUF1553)
MRHIGIRTAVGCVLAALALLTARVGAAEPAKGGLRMAPIKAEAWKGAPTTRATPAEIDGIIARELQAAGVKPAPRTTDEQFIRRVSLDLTGRLPLPADVSDFIADTKADKRARLIDRLLDSDAYAAHWGRYWRDVMSARLTDFRARILSRSFTVWITQQLKDNKPWDKITRDLLTANGEIRFNDDGKAGNLFFVASHNGAETANELAAETSRVFLGIQINCAQCHDHPYDAWKREQFHEMAAFFARTRSRLVREEQRFVGVAMFSFGRFEHRMPSKDDPRRGTTVHPRFLDGQSAGRYLGDVQRRNRLADAIVSKDNYWFSAAFVNRMWGELLGQAFYQPIDDLGPRREAVLGPALVRMAGSFRGTDHDIKGLFRLILNTETYQRQSRLGETASEHLQFAAAYPTRIRSDALWDSLVGVLGPMSGRFGFPGRRGPGGRRGFGGFGLEGQFKEEFRFDPSLKHEDVEGSIPQALIMMNNPLIQQKIEARGTNLLGRILSSQSDDGKALEMVYLRALARKPTAREQEKCLGYIKKVSNRAEAFEDILWALINSTEFQTKR